jgi:hypothetical protein
MMADINYGAKMLPLMQAATEKYTKNPNGA